MSSSSFAPILLNSFKAIASLFLQYVIGAVVAWVGVIKEGDMRAFSAIMNAVLIPLLSVVSLGRGLSPAVFASDGWILALLGCLSMLEYAALAFALRPLAKPEPQFRRIFVLMMSIGNVVAIPLSVTQSLCELGAFEVELAEAECLIRSRALVFTYVSFNSFFIWVVAYGYVSNDGPEAEPISTAKTTGEPTVSAQNSRSAEEGPLGADPVGGADPEEGADPAGSADPADAPVAVLEVAAPKAAPAATTRPEPSRESRHRTWVELARATGSRRRLSGSSAVGASGSGAVEASGALIRPLRFVRKQLLSLLQRPPVVGLFVGLLIGLVPPLQRVLFDRGAALAPVGQALSTLSDGTVPVMNLMLGFSMGHKLKGLSSWKQLLGSAQAGISRRTMSVLTLGKMLVLPSIQSALLYALLRGGALPPSRLARVIAFVEAAPPTASIVVVLAHMARKPRAAQLVAWAIVPQYVLAVFSLTLVIAFALAITEP